MQGNALIGSSDAPSISQTMPWVSPSLSTFTVGLTVRAPALLCRRSLILLLPLRMSPSLSLRVRDQRGPTWIFAQRLERRRGPHLHQRESRRQRRFCIHQRSVPVAGLFADDGRAEADHPVLG